MKPISIKPVQHRVFAFLLLLLLALAILGVMIGRNLHHFNSALTHVNYSHSVQHVSKELQELLIDYLTDSISVAYPEDLSRTLLALNNTMSQIENLKTESEISATGTVQSMSMVKKLLSDVAQLNRVEKNARMIEALKLTSQALDDEVLRREQLLAEISLHTETELTLALVTFVVILIVALMFFRRRILHPLNDLRQLLQRLSTEDYTQIKTDHLDPLLLPVFNSYNEMVRHLAELEEAKRLYAESLQHEVRMATQALLEQQHTLARAERLAAIGEVTAELAHEIRNPLAGIQVAISNLRREVDNQDQCARLELISNEIKRLSRLFNETLDQSRHMPEASIDLNLASLIRDLVTLTRYQIAESITLTINIPAVISVHLPESGIRQVLLNLILNSAEALEQKKGTIQIKAKQIDQGVQIEVADDGPGFPKDVLERGIQPFRTNRPRGTGLGLAIVQRFVREIGGTLKLSNNESHGACVSLFLPSTCLTTGGGH